MHWRHSIARAMCRLSTTVTVQHQMGGSHHHHCHQMLGPSACQSPSQSRHLSAACHLVPKVPLSSIGRQMQNAVFLLAGLKSLWRPSKSQYFTASLPPKVHQSAHLFTHTWAYWQPSAEKCVIYCYTASSLGKIWLKAFWVGEQGAHSSHWLLSPASRLLVSVKASKQVIGGVVMRAPKLAASWLQSQWSSAPVASCSAARLPRHHRQ